MSASNTTAGFEKTVGYVPDPKGRGTLSLVLSCLLTLLLCVWQALHLNVPAHRQTPWQRCLQNLRWIITGIYAPEFVVFTAWRQWSSSNILSSIILESHVKKIKDDRIESEYQQFNRPYEWTQTHSFFTSTGGFAFEVEQDPDKLPFLPHGCSKRLTITARGMALLARCGKLPQVRVEEILDKSKANALAKALIVIQATWMLIQTVGRFYGGLPVTLLEVNTVAHVLCALLMYALWWHKPLLAKEPIIIRGDWVNPICAFMLMSSELSGVVDETEVKSQTVIKTLFASLNLFSKSPETDTVTLRHNPKTFVIEFSQASSTCNALWYQRRQNTFSDTAFFERRPKIIAPASITSAFLSKTTNERRRLAAEAVDLYSSILETQILMAHNHHKTGDDPDPLNLENYCMHLKSEELLTTRARNWPGDDLLRNVNGLTVGMILWLSNLCYGGLHLAAWNDQFPSDLERWLWRVSALYIGFCGGLWIVLNWVTLRCNKVNEFWERWMDGEKKWWSNVGLGALVVGCGGALCCARCFIVVEAFISIRRLGERAYQTPGWTEVVPHF